MPDARRRIRGPNQSGLVVTQTPLRVSFAGGGTDLPAFYEADHGAVFSTTIDKYVYVTVKRHGPVFDEKIRLNYSVSEAVGHIDADERLGLDRDPELLPTDATDAGFRQLTRLKGHRGQAPDARQAVVVAKDAVLHADAARIADTIWSMLLFLPTRPSVCSSSSLTFATVTPPAVSAR